MFRRVVFFFFFASVDIYAYPGIDEEIGLIGQKFLKNKFHYTDATTLIELAEELCEKWEFGAALRFYDKAIKLRPDEESFLARGKFYKQRRKLDLAIADLKQAVRSDIDRKFLIEVYIDSGLWEEAVDETLKLKDHGTIVNFAGEFSRLTKFHEAIRCLNKALIMEPNAEYYNLRGNCYVSIGRLEKALDDFERSVELNKNLPVAQKPEYERVLLCLAFIDLGKFEEVLQEIRNLESFQHITLVTDSLLTLKKFNEAISCYTEAIKRYPEMSSFYEKRAKCYKELGDFENAVLDFQELTKLSPYNPRFCLDLIDSLVKAKRYADARDVLKNRAALLKNVYSSDETWLMKLEKEIYSALEKSMQEMEKKISVS